MIDLATMKAYLRISGSTYDSFLTEQEAVIADAVQNYTGRIFNSNSYVETYYKSDYTWGVECLRSYHYPLISVASVKEFDKAGNELYDYSSEVRLQKPLGMVIHSEGFFIKGGDYIEISYTAGYATIPPVVKSVVLSLVEERYNKKVAGVSLNFGSDVQRVSIPGTISIDFDYSLNSNERTSAFGTILGNYGNSLDFYRSERAVIGSGTITYVG